MDRANPGFHIQPLGRNHNRARFSCEVEPLERYLKQQASQDARRNIAATFVLLSHENQIAGYYTLSSASLRLDDLPTALINKLKLPRYPQLPATLLGRLARHSAFRGQGIGELLLLDALKRSYEISKQIASLAVIVDAKNEPAAAFYARYGFIPFPETRDRLFLTMSTIGQLFEKDYDPDSR